MAACTKYQRRNFTYMSYQPIHHIDAFRAIKRRYTKRYHEAILSVPVLVVNQKGDKQVAAASKNDQLIIFFPLDTVWDEKTAVRHNH